MKRLLFDELLLASLREKKAKRVQFHPELTVVKGANDTGKSSLLKSIYRCFGAIPKRMHGRWQDAHVKAVLRFRVDGDRYSILQDGESYTLFDGRDRVIRRCGSVSTELTPLVSELLDFRLTLVSRGKTPATPPPAYLFLPFYVDQDSSWQHNWAAFSRLQQFADWRRDVVEYHVGIKPNDYYVTKGGLAQLQERIREPREKHAALDAILKDLRQRLKQVSFTYDIEDYREQVRRLLVECDGLSRKEELLKDRLVRLYSRKTSLEAQVEIAKHAMFEMGRDYTYACESLEAETVECPTCGAAYDNSFVERFEIARDEDRCHELLTELTGELASLEREIAQERARYGDARHELDQITSILSRKQGEIRLQDIIESEGQKQVRAIIEKDIETVRAMISQLDLEMEALRKKLHGYEKSDRKKRILGEYDQLMRSFLHDLHVDNLSPESYSRVYSEIKETGSDLPRALLAYYFSILHLVGTHGSSAFCPIVVDAPHQQDQDRANSEKMLVFMRDNRPKDSQLILGLVDTFGVKFPGDTITLHTKDSLLDEDAFDDVMGTVRPMLDSSMHAGLFNRDGQPSQG